MKQVVNSQIQVKCCLMVEWYSSDYFIPFSRVILRVSARVQCTSFVTALWPFQGFAFPGSRLLSARPSIPEVWPLERRDVVAYDRLNTYHHSKRHSYVSGLWLAARRHRTRIWPSNCCAISRKHRHQYWPQDSPSKCLRTTGSELPVSGPKLP